VELIDHFLFWLTRPGEFLLSVGPAIMSLTQNLIKGIQGSGSNAALPAPEDEQQQGAAGSRGEDGERAGAREAQPGEAVVASEAEAAHSNGGGSPPRNGLVKASSQRIGGGVERRNNGAAGAGGQAAAAPPVAVVGRPLAVAAN
jgi:hypothetical protein